MRMRNLVVGLAMSLGVGAWASHYLGGDLTYECLGPTPGNTTRYRFRFTLYRDCKGISAPPSVTLNYSSTQCGVNSSITLNPIPGTGTDITPLIACSGYTSSCPSGGSNYGIQRWVYEGIVSLPAGCGSDWVFHHNNCCRSNDIDNITNPSGTGSAFYVRLDNTVTPCNSSPQFTNLPQMFNCVNTPTLLNLGLTDLDGDSLAIELTYCRDDNPAPPSSSVSYVAPYSGTNPFPTFSGILINPSTGTFSYIPSTAIRAVFCYRVREFRNGVEIGETYQDVYLIIQNCPPSSPPSATATTSTQSNPVNYDEGNPNTFTFQVPVCPLGGGQQSCLNLEYKDNVNPSPANQLQVTVVQTPPGATVTITGNNTNNVLVQICWTPTPADIGNYNVVVSVSNNTCPIRGRWDYTYVLRVRPGIQKNNQIAVIRAPGDTVVTRDTLLCRGSRVRLYLTVRDSVPPSDISSVIWTATGGATPPPSFPPNPLSQAIAPTITVTQTATYTATITYRGGCVDRDTIRIRMQTPDTLRISPDPASICVGDTLNLTATSALNLPIRWYAGAPLTGTLLASGNSLSYIPAPPPGQIALYAVTTDTLGCNYIDTVLVDIQEGPPFTATTTSAICRGQNNGSITVTPNVAGNYNYTLYNGGGGVVAGPISTGQFSNLAPGAYIVAVQGPLPIPCTSYDTVYVGQGDSVTVAILGDSIQYRCPPYQATFQVVASTTLNAAVTYLWNFGNGNTQTTTATTVSQTYLIPGVYVVVVQASTPQGCFATDTVIVNTLNPLGLTAQPAPVCKGAVTGVVTLTLGGNPRPPVLYSASPVVPGSGPVFPPQSSPIFTNIPVGILYEFIAQDSLGCQGRDTVLLQVTDSVEILSLNHGLIPDCYPVAVSLTAQAQGTGSLTYYWDFGNGGRDTTQTPNTTALYSAGGNYTVTLIVMNSAGCRDTAALPLFIPATGERIDAQITSAGPLSGCVPLTVNFEGTGTSSIGSALTFTWDFRDGNTTSGTQATHTFTQPGYYNVVFYAQSSPQCYDTAQVLVWVDGQPQAQIIAPPLPSQIGYYVASPLTFTAAPGPYHVRFFWQADSQAAATGPTYTITYLQKGTYCVYLTVESELGCKDTAVHCFDVSGYVLLIPNTFTPNGDGINDIFKIIGYGMEYIELTIYDRWGQQIYAARGTEQVQWDGTKGGTAVPEGAYVYLVRYKLVDKEGVEYRSGTVTLLR